MIKTGCEGCKELSQSNWAACFWALKIVDGDEVKVWIEARRVWLAWHLMKGSCEWFRTTNQRTEWLNWKGSAKGSLNLRTWREDFKGKR